MITPEALESYLIAEEGLGVLALCTIPFAILGVTVAAVNRAGEKKYRERQKAAPADIREQYEAIKKKAFDYVSKVCRERKMQAELQATVQQVISQIDDDDVGDLSSLRKSSPKLKASQNRDGSQVYLIQPDDQFAKALDGVYSYNPESATETLDQIFRSIGPSIAKAVSLKLESEFDSVLRGFVTITYSPATESSEGVPSVVVKLTV